MGFYETVLGLIRKAPASPPPPLSSNAPITLTRPISQACTQAQFGEAAYAYWCGRILEEPRFHRKQWEFCYILQALATAGALAPGFRGVGFGVGLEPLPSLFAAMGIDVLATDLDTEDALRTGWVASNQHAAEIVRLNARGLCDPESFDRRVTFRFADMNRLPEDVRGYDFCWSSCALEHLGSIRQGLDFILNSLDLLRAGGVAVHTTELNCGEGEETMDDAPTVLFRRSDFLGLAEAVRGRGHTIELSFDLGDGPVDRHVDVAPYSGDHHLKLRLADHVTTSFGVIVRKQA